MIPVQIKMVLCAGAVLVLSMQVSAVDTDNIGDFDISKVREAALTSDTTAGASEVAVPVEREHVFNVVLRLMLYLGVVIGLIAVCAWFFRRKGLQALRGGGGAMDIIETLPVGQNRMLLMVRVMDEIYFMSQTSAHISLIEKIGGQKALDIIASSKGGGTIVHFKDALNSFMGKMKKNV